MTNTETRARIIRDLEERSGGAADGEWMTISCADAREIVALLKEQEARVMKEEIVLCTDWVWCEYTSGYQGWYKMEEYDTQYDLIRWEDTTVDIVDDYGFRWRAWTSRPSEQQMRETKWEGDNDAEK